MAHELSVNEDHPLALELASLRTAVHRYQHEAHTASVKLQRHSLDTTHALEGARQLEQENQRLSDELAILRAKPDITPHPASLQVPELTLALRKLSDKLTLTEETLATRTHELITSQLALSQAQLEVRNAQSLTAHARDREAAGRVRERELEQKAKVEREERKMADLVVQEYADLVRSLEGRSKGPRASIQMTREASSSSITLVESLAEGKTGLHKLLGEFHEESERHATDMFQLQGKLDTLTVTLESERKNAEDLRSQLASALTELDKHKVDDNTAAKMVSRYMKFSQSTTDALQKAMDSLKTRHAATTSTLEAQVASMQKSLLFERKQSETLRHALDELSEDISREAYGRRREISLRLAFLGREEGLAETLRRWIRKSKESFTRVLSKQPQPTNNSSLIKAFERIIEEAEMLLESLNGLPSSEDELLSGSVGRILVAQDVATNLTRELRQETSRRLEAERRLAHFESSEGGPSLEVPALTVPNIRSTEESSLDIIKNNGDISKLDLPRRSALVPLAPPTPEGEEVERLSSPQMTLLSEAAQEPHVSSQDPPLQDPIPHEADLKPAPLETYPIEIPPFSPGVLDVQQLQSTLSETSTSPPSKPAQVYHDPSPIQDDEENPSQTSSADQAIFPSNTAVGGAADDVVLSVGAESLSIAITSTEVLADIQQPADSLPEIVVAPVETLPSPLPIEQEFVGEISPAASSPAILERDAESEPFSSSPWVERLASESNHPAVIKLSSIAPSVSLSPQRRASPTPSLDTQQRLLADLRSTQQRYDSFQKSFRDCDMALKDLKHDVGKLPDNLEMVLVVQTAVERLRDYNEDARVELEIRISDEERIHTGYTTLLSIPGAISDEVDAEELENEINAFVSGEDKAVTKAMQQLIRKLDDLQHDIASVKLSVHELTSSVEQQAGSEGAAGNQGGWSAWTGGLLGPPRPSSPAPITFGSVMTSPRLRHSASLSRMSSRSASESDTGGSTSPFAGLGLRIPMPAHILPRRPSTLPGIGRPGSRPRVSSASAMYLLGLGARSSSLGSSPQKVLVPAVSSPIGRRMSVKEDDENVESDVE